MTTPLRVLVGCESSGTVRDAFLAAGHYAISADLLPSTSDAGDHYQGDVRDLFGEPFDLAILHPPCTYLSRVSAPALARDPSRRAQLEDAAGFFRQMLDAPFPRIAVENPTMLFTDHQLIGERATQYVEPHWFGHPWTKKTGLWLRGLPLLQPTELVEPTGSWVVKHRDWGTRSKTFAGLAAAMVEQWASDDVYIPHPRPLFDLELSA